jgi:hypothetical protein
MGLVKSLGAHTQEMMEIVTKAKSVKITVLMKDWNRHSSLVAMNDSVPWIFRSCLP